MGVSLGKVNYCLKALVDVGQVKFGNFAASKNKLGYAYLLTPKGVKEKTKAAVNFLKIKQRQYDTIKKILIFFRKNYQVLRQIKVAHLRNNKASMKVLLIFGTRP